MSDPNTPRNYSELEARLQDFGERAKRALRKAAEKTRETDWEAVSRDLRNAIERAVGGLDAAFREVVSEFDSGATTGGSGAGKTSGATAQRIPVDKDPVDSTASAASADDRAARRRDILARVKSGEITLEQAEALLRDL